MYATPIEPPNILAASLFNASLVLPVSLNGKWELSFGKFSDVAFTLYLSDKTLNSKALQIFYLGVLEQRLLHVYAFHIFQILRCKTF